MEFSENHNALFLLKVPQDNEILIRTLSDQGLILLLTNKLSYILKIDFLFACANFSDII